MLRETVLTEPVLMEDPCTLFQWANSSAACICMQAELHGIRQAADMSVKVKQSLIFGEFCVIVQCWIFIFCIVCILCIVLF